MTGEAIHELIERRMAATDETYREAMHRILADGGPLVQAYAAGEVTERDLGVRLRAVSRRSPS